MKAEEEAQLADGERLKVEEHKRTQMKVEGGSALPLN